jgi:pSer/pThr/pTyr-binding forkhead associated (FHA) protein
MFAQLVVLNGPHKGRKLSVRRHSLLIGNAEVCQLRLKHKGVCPRHCALLLRAGRFSIHDLASASGTFVNDVRITTTVGLKPGDRIHVGPVELEIDWEPEWLRSESEEDLLVRESEEDTIVESGAPEEHRTVGVSRSCVGELTAVSPSDAAAGALNQLLDQR